MRRVHCSLWQVCNTALLNQPFVHAKVSIWTSTIIENVLKELAVTNTEAAKKGTQKFKYVGARRSQSDAAAAQQPSRQAAQLPLQQQHAWQRAAAAAAAAVTHNAAAAW